MLVAAGLTAFGALLLVGALLEAFIDWLFSRLTRENLNRRSRRGEW